MNKGYIDGFTCSWQEDCFNYKIAKHFKEKLDKIKKICQTYDKNGVYYNLTEDIMKVIEGAEDE